MTRTRQPAAPGYMDAILRGMEQKPGLTPINGGRKKQYAEHYRYHYGKWRKQLLREGKSPSVMRATPVHSEKRARREQARIEAEQQRRERAEKKAKKAGRKYRKFLKDFSEKAPPGTIVRELDSVE